MIADWQLINTNSSALGTRRIFEDYHDEFRSSVRKFFEKEVVPYHSQWEEDGEVSRELWLKAGGSGLLGLTTPGIIY